MRRWSVLLLAVALLSGCGPGDPKPVAGAGRGDDGVAPLLGATKPAFPSGLVLLGDREGSPSARTLTTALLVHDAATGAVAGRYALPGWMSSISRDQFSADYTLLVWADCDLHAARLTGTAYLEFASWKPPQTFTSSKNCFADPRVDLKDGQIRVTVGPGGTDTERGLYSADPGRPDQPVKDLGPRGKNLDNHGLIPRYGSGWKIPGAADDTVWLRVTDDGLLSGTVSGYSGYNYQCGARLDDQTLLCTHQLGAKPFGALAALTADRTANTVALRQLAPATDAKVTGVWVAPDRKRLLVHTDSGWYTLDPTGGEPRLAFQDLAGPRSVWSGEPAFWS